MRPDRGRSERSFAPPRWVYRALWTLHRAGYAISGGRLGLRAGAADRLGTLRLTTTGRTSGRERSVMLFYLPYGESQAVVASNAGAARSPAWWLNVQAEPLASVDLPGGSTRVRARVADPQEHAALWARSTEQLDDYARYAASAEREIPVVILEPLPKEAHA